ncbi:MAG: hypothetical protein QF893_11300 [Alphaproteobacteria bacterium]|jgi:hypothetical protein|nr:hypothetical protein [Alphaproteobacteria bacterium]
MIDDVMSHRILLEVRSDTDLLHEMIGIGSQCDMELDLLDLTGPGHGEPLSDHISPRSMDGRPVAGSLSRPQ